MGNCVGNSRRGSSVLVSAVYKAPEPFYSENDFFENWLTWKTQFLTYADGVEIKQHKRGLYLLNYMGLVGQSIHAQKLSFANAEEKENIDALLYKFDYHYVFGNCSKQCNNIENAVQHWKEIVKSKGINNSDRYVKDKIIQDIGKDRFANVASKFKINITYEESVSYTLQELMFISTQYQESGYCQRCGMSHPLHTCFAEGKQCFHCHDYGHFRKRCPKLLIDNCQNCGVSHLRGRCLAYGSTCKKCLCVNHFFWNCLKCTLKCWYCNQYHVMHRAVCPALHNLCTNCGKLGHVPSACRARRR